MSSRYRPTDCCARQDYNALLLQNGHNGIANLIIVLHSETLFWNVFIAPPPFVFISFSQWTSDSDFLNRKAIIGGFGLKMHFMALSLFYHCTCTEIPPTVLSVSKWTSNLYPLFQKTYRPMRVILHYSVILKAFCDFVTAHAQKHQLYYFWFQNGPQIRVPRAEIHMHVGN